MQNSSLSDYALKIFELRRQEVGEVFVALLGDYNRWSAFVSAKVNGEAIPLGPVHWARGLQAVVPFPYQRPSEASAMGGGGWQDNFDGTYTQLDDDYYVPATGYSYLDLYLMGLISPAEVPDFFILRNLVPAGKDAHGHPIFKAERTKITGRRSRGIERK